jgi:hypothetical protein
MAEAAAGKDHTMTKAELVEEVTRITELPRKESEAVVESIFESIIPRFSPTTKSRYAASAASARASGADVPAEIQKPAPKWKSHQKKSPFSNLARN